MLALITTLIGAPVGIGVVATDDWVIASGVADALERSIDRSLMRGAVRLPNDEGCQEQARPCADRARNQVALSEVVLLRVFSGVTKHLVIAEGFPLEGDARKVTVSLPTSGRGWEVELAVLIRELLPPEPDANPPPAPSIQTASIGLWGPALIIASAVIVGAAAILSSQAAGARMDLLARDESAAEFDRLTDKRDDYRLSSLVMFGLGGLLAGSGIMLVLFDL